MYFGADYYPEHWPREDWERHARQMKEANLNIVRLAEFAWAKLEPTRGNYDFTWLDEAIEVLAKEGIQVVLGTPTATPPKWLMDEYPDIYTIDAYGRQRGFGSRRHYCHNNPNYHRESRRIVAKLAEHYKDHPSVVAWQIDNEFGCHDDTVCYCNNCLSRFKAWLQQKYSTVENLNKEWGTIFWSQTYNSWNEVIVPAYTQCEGLNSRNFAHNPGLLLDYQRFCSDSTIAYQKLQVDELKSVGCKQPITHNFMGHFAELDLFDLAKDLDFVSWDNYINMQWGQSPYYSISMAHDLMRGLKRKNFWVMEQQSGPCGWSVMGDTPKPGQLRLWTYQSIAHGAEAIVYFRWRACTFGTEEYWYGILDHDGIPRRRYREVQQTGAELKALSDYIVDSKVVTETAIIKSYDNVWSHRFQPHNSKFDYNGLLMSYYHALNRNQINTDVTAIDTDLSGYKLVFAPAFNLMTGELQARLEDYVRNGGSLVVTFRSGTRHWNNSMTTETLPGYFRNLSGVEVEEFDSINFDREVRVQGICGEGKAVTWCDVLKPVTASVLASYASDYYAGQPAITVNVFGKGRVYYIGCDLDAAGMEQLVKHIAGEARIQPALPQLPEGVEAVLKEKNGEKYLMLLNYTGAPAVVSVDGYTKELITGTAVKGSLELPPYGVAVIR